MLLIYSLFYWTLFDAKKGGVLWDASPSVAPSLKIMKCDFSHFGTIYIQNFLFLVNPYILHLYSGEITVWSSFWFFQTPNCRFSFWGYWWKDSTLWCSLQLAPVLNSNLPKRIQNKITKCCAVTCMTYMSRHRCPEPTGPSPLPTSTRSINGLHGDVPKLCK